MDQFTIYHNDKKTLNLIARRGNGDPFDLTTATEIQVTFDTPNGNTPLVKKLSVSAGVVISDAKFGKFGIPLVAADSAQLNVADNQDVEVIITTPSEGPITIPYPKILNVRKHKGEA